MALAMDCESLTTFDENGNIVSLHHQEMNNPCVLHHNINILIPNVNKQWEPSYYSIGTKEFNNDEVFAYKGISRLLDDERFIDDYLNYWMISFNAYCNKDESSNIYWLINACGKPANLPETWAGGTTCISDEKTSVGMDRTDDIKKGIYQVLKLGVEGKLEYTGWDCKVGILSNIHPARHFNVYLRPIKDLIWTICPEKDVDFAKDLDPNAPMYNLFDGIITFTDNYIRDKWLSENLVMLL